jgi:hypothetical protein
MFYQNGVCGYMLTKWRWDLSPNKVELVVMCHQNGVFCLYADKMTLGFIF